MKHLHVLLLAGLLLAGCVGETDLNYLQKQIDDLKSDQIASINNQIASIQVSIGRLEGADTELRGYIQTLNEQRTALERTDQELTQSIIDLKAELEGEITDAQNSALTLLETYRTTITGQLTALSNSIAALEAKDQDLQNQITNLKAYVDGGIQSCKDWVSATFVTLEQYNATAAAVAGIQAQIATINQQIQQLTDSQALMATKEELSQAISTLDSLLQAKIQTAVNNSNAALNTAREEITAAYTTAIQTAIASCESSLKTWVNQQLSGYYTISETEALLEALRTSLEGQLNTQNYQLGILIANAQSSIESHKASIDSLRSRIGKLEEDVAGLASLRADLDSSKNQITRAYQKAIQEAIESLDGKITAQIAEEVSTINTRIDNEVSQINEALTALSNRVSQCESDIQSLQNEISGIKTNISKLLARIQSLTYVPRYSDGQARIYFDKNGDDVYAENLTLDFEVHPNSAAADLASVWEQAITLKAVSTITTKAAPSFIEIPILSLEANAGIISLSANVASLPASFFNGETSINACLSISDGTSDLVSEYVPVLAVNREIQVTTLPATDVNTGTATLHGCVQRTNVVTPTEIGFYYGSSPASLLESGTKVICNLQEDDTYSTVLTGLVDGTTYYLAYAKVDSKIYCGDTKNFVILTTIQVGGAVDLGLSVLWATCNIGAESPEDYGQYYAWGETGIKEFYNHTNYKWFEVNNIAGQDVITLKKYNNSVEYGETDAYTRLLLSDDIANIKLGGKWRMPTNDEWRELIKECDWSYTNINNMNGLVASRNGHSIFIPLAGSRVSNLLYYFNEECNYWSSSLCVDNPTLAMSFYGLHDAQYLSTNYFLRSHGYSVRPVYDPDLTMASSITLDEPQLTIISGESQIISATVLPNNATYKSVAWSSSDNNVATVDANGNITAISKGTATITATATDGTGVSASCTVRVMNHAKPEGAVDLGLSVYWAACNVGASYPEHYGIYVAWGEVQSYYSSLSPLTWRSGKEAGYDWSSYRWCNGNDTSFTKYNTNESSGIVDNLTTLELNDDAAYSFLGKHWRMPTRVEWMELREKCTCVWTTQGARDGILITGPNGNSIFLPAGGEWSGTTLYGEETYGSYWTSSLRVPTSTHSAYYIEFRETLPNVSWDDDLRYYGKNIRPVFD
ncbi:MAG: Ig-like domain-containing protein [Bacteroidales bacterium]|nr:Ig-like domain-containing protein [Bacteroidales bacterium]